MTLTLDTVREYLKLDQECEDATLSLYVQAAIKAAERTTGQALTPGWTVDVHEWPAERTQAFRLSATPNGAVVAKIFVGGLIQHYPATVSGKQATLPVAVGCGVARVELRYRIGPPEELARGLLVDADPMIELGILKFVAHAYQCRGDDPNRWTTDSGALDLWRPLMTVAF